MIMMALVAFALGVAVGYITCSVVAMDSVLDTPRGMAGDDEEGDADWWNRTSG